MCPGATADLTFEIGGTMTYDANGTFSSALTGISRRRSCESSSRPEVSDSPGTYTISGDMVVVARDGATSTVSDCVQAGVLYKSRVPNDGA